MPDQGFPITRFRAVLDSEYAGAVMTGMQWKLQADGEVLCYPGSGGDGGGGTVPIGTGFVHITSGAQDAAAKLVTNADVATAAGILESKLALNYATHSNALDHPNTNDPSTGEKAALVGTSGTPGASNKYVTNADARLSDARTPTAHTHPSTAITDFAEAVDDRVAALLIAGTNITLTYDDTANTLTIAATGGGGSIPGLVGAKCHNSGVFGLGINTPGGKSIFTVEDYDSGGFFDAAAPGEFVVPAGESGYYLLQAEALFYTVASLSGERVIDIRDKVTPTTVHVRGRVTVATNSWHFNISGVVYLAAGAVVEIVFNQGTATALDVDNGKFSITKLAT